MPLRDHDLSEVRSRVLRMFMDTITTFEMIEKNADQIYGDKAPDVRAAINEYLDDFLRNPGNSGENHPEQVIYQTPLRNFQHAGLYGAQLNLKERQLSAANATLRERIAAGIHRLRKKSFRWWIDIINNFLGSLVSATGLGEALKELKDCLRDQLPDDAEE